METTEGHEVNGDFTAESRWQAAHDREVRLYALAETDPDVRMLICQRDAARFKLNVAAMALGGACDEPWPGHCVDFHQRMRESTHAGSMFERWCKELAERAQSKAEADAE